MLDDGWVLWNNFNARCMGCGFPYLCCLVMQQLYKYFTEMYTNLYAACTKSSVLRVDMLQNNTHS